MCKTLVFHVLATVAVAGLLLFPVWGQNIPVSVFVRGSVKTPQGAAVSFATLTIGANTLKADQDGRFETSAMSMPSGLLILSAIHPGFERTTRVANVQANNSVQGDFVLSPSPDCPSEADSIPPAGPLFSTDFVEIEIPAGMSAGYRMRIRADGEVLRRGTPGGDFFVEEDRKVVSIQDARALIEKFRTREFWSLCGGYHPVGLIATTDGPLTYTTVQIDNQIRRIVDDYRTAPEFLRAVQLDFLTLANRNRSGLGAPPQVPIPGPETTAGGVRRMFADRDINALDSNGWTPLMYATQLRWTPKAVRLLLDVGANPNSRSAIGDTALMVAVTAQRPIEDAVRWLLAAGANVNAQDREGRTPLILAVQRFALPEGGPSEGIISLLLAAGARRDIRDGHGMTALDYAEQDAKRAPKYPEKNYEGLNRILAGY